MRTQTSQNLLPFPMSSEIGKIFSEATLCINDQVIQHIYIMISLSFNSLIVFSAVHAVPSTNVDYWSDFPNERKC